MTGSKKIEVSKKQIIFGLLLLATCLIFYIGSQFPRSTPKRIANYLLNKFVLDECDANGSGCRLEDFKKSKKDNSSVTTMIRPGLNQTTLSETMTERKIDTNTINATMSKLGDIKHSRKDNSSVTPRLESGFNLSMIDEPNDNVTLYTSTWKEPLICPEEPPFLVGPLYFMKTPMTLETLLDRYPYVEPGGRIRPRHCRARQRVAVIIPFRNRHSHLYVLLNNLIPMIDRQMNDVSFIVVEQNDTITFNRAALFNIGFLESLKLFRFDCFIFHDVDMVPANDRNFYRCGQTPKHFVAGMDTIKYKLPYSDYYGGVVGMTKDQYQLINGHSNLYFGWGGEDDDLLVRCRNKGFKLVRNPVTIGLYSTFVHSRDKGNEPGPTRFRLLGAAKARQAVEGLNTVKYNVSSIELKPLYTLIKARIDVKGIVKAAPSSVSKLVIAGKT